MNQKLYQLMIQALDSRILKTIGIISKHSTKEKLLVGFSKMKIKDGDLRDKHNNYYLKIFQ